MHRQTIGVLSWVLSGFLLSPSCPTASAKDTERDWKSATVIDVFPPERQKAKPPKSLDPSITMPRQSPFPVYTALGANTRWVFVFESGDVTYVATIRALRGDSRLRKLESGDSVRVARHGKRDIYVLIEDAKEEKLHLLEEPSATNGKP